MECIGRLTECTPALDLVLPVSTVWHSCVLGVLVLMHTNTLIMCYNVSGDYATPTCYTYPLENVHLFILDH